MFPNNLTCDKFKPFRSCVLVEVCSVDILVACWRICAGSKEDSFRETNLWEHFCRTDKIALVTCLKNWYASSTLLVKNHSQQGIIRSDIHSWEEFLLTIHAVDIAECLGTEPETGTVGTFSRNGTQNRNRGTRFSGTGKGTRITTRLKCVETLPRGTAGTETQNRSNRSTSKP